MLDRMKMARSTFYYNLKQLGQSDGYDDIRHRIQEIYAKHQGRYGYRRITAQLHNEGIEINHKTVHETDAADEPQGQAQKAALSLIQRRGGESGSQCT